MDGCMYNLTKTTENRSSQVRVRGYYYVPSLAIGQSSLVSRLLLRGRFVDTFVSRVNACTMHEHTRRNSRLCEPFLSVFEGGVGQEALTVPTSTTQRFRHSVARAVIHPNGDSSIWRYRKVPPAGGAAFIPFHEWRRLPAAVVNCPCKGKV